MVAKKRIIRKRPPVKRNPTYRYYVHPVNPFTNKVIATLLNKTTDEISTMKCTYGNRKTEREVWEVNESQLKSLRMEKELVFDTFKGTSKSRTPHFIGSNTSFRSTGGKEIAVELIPATQGE